ncbi:hypothetical protein [Streptomyces lavendulocolor]|uniref:hypothetical protein n=1 Tax=Streptomyces lavendulocolor TaxID=67316 RepID=UPI0031D2CCAC
MANQNTNPVTEEERAEMRRLHAEYNTFEKRDVPEPPALDKKALMAAVGIAVEKSLKLVAPVIETGEDDARSMLGKMMAGLQQVWNEQHGWRRGGRCFVIFLSLCR